MISMLLAVVLANGLEAEWREVSIRFIVREDAALQMTEWGVLEVPPLATGVERTYFTDDEQRLTFDGVLIDGVDVALDTTTPGTVRWSMTPGTYRYIIASTVTGAVVPGWDIPRGGIRDFDPRALRVDYHWFIPPGVNQLELWQMGWPDDWKPARPIDGRNIGEETPEGYRIRHLFRTAHPGPPPGRRSATLRVGAIVLYPVAALLFWMIYAIREVRRRRIELPAFDPARILAEAPEVIEAQWSGVAPFPSIESFLRRLERQRKIALTIVDDEEADDINVNVRLLVPRDRLTEYERAGIEALIPEGLETSTADIRRRHANEEFDPADALHAALQKTAEESTGPLQDIWYSKLFSFVVFWGGVIVFVGDSLRANVSPKIWIAGILASLFLGVAWPGTLVRRELRKSSVAVLWPLIGIVLTTIAIVALHLLAPAPIPPYASIGLSVLMLAAYKTILTHSTGRETAASLKRQRELALAREWLRNSPGVHDEIREAFALKRAEKRPGEEWGWALGSWPD